MYDKPGPSLPTAKPQQPQFAVGADRGAEAPTAGPAGPHQLTAFERTGIAPIGARLLTLRAAGAALGIGRSTVFELLRRGDLEARKLGSRTLVTVESLERLVAALPRAAYRPPAAASERPSTQVAGVAAGQRRL